MLFIKMHTEQHFSEMAAGQRFELKEDIIFDLPPFSRLHNLSGGLKEEAPKKSIRVEKQRCSSEKDKCAITIIAQVGWSLSVTD